MSADIGIIVQGPLITFGQVPNNSVEGFNTLNTIINNIKNIRKAGFKYIIATWKPSNSDEELILENLSENNFNVLILDTPAVFDPDHRYKHHYGIYKGMEELKKAQEIRFFAKIRTDMLMPVEFYSFLEAKRNENSPKLFVSHLLNSAFYIGDFVYAGNSIVLEKFLKSMVLSEKIIHPSISHDIGLKYFLSINEERKKQFRNNIFDIYKNFVFDIQSVEKIWADFTEKNLETFSKNLWQEILWRDKKIENVVNSDFFLFSTEFCYERANFKKLFGLICEDYKRYMSKSRNIALYHIFNLAGKVF